MRSSVGVLALQGGFHLHIKQLKRLAIDTQEIRLPEELALVSALIIPGGESTALLELMQPMNFFEAIADFAAKKKPIWGTCAGAILLAKEVKPEQRSMGLIDLSVERNAYGRQLESHIAQGQLEESLFKSIGRPPRVSQEMVFIRAPKIEKIGPGVKVLARVNDVAVMAQEHKILVSTFHPELSEDLSCHRYFISLIK